MLSSIAAVRRSGATALCRLVGGATTHSAPLRRLTALRTAVGQRTFAVAPDAVVAAGGEDAEVEAASLGEVAARELGYERSDTLCPSYETLETQMRRALDDWDVDVCRSQSHFRLVKRYGDETVSVEVNACSPETIQRGSDAAEHVDLGAREGEEEGTGAEEGDIDVVSMLISVEKEGQANKMILSAGISMEQEPEMELVGVQFVPRETTLTDLLSTRQYEGPEFSELDVALQKGFHDFLLERGFDERFAEAIRDLSDMKEETEYISWLETLHSFTEGPEVPSLGEQPQA